VILLDANVVLEDLDAVDVVLHAYIIGYSPGEIKGWLRFRRGFFRS
jgi:hypothetical protein